MNFLNEKKNLPIILGVAAIALILAVVSGLYFTGIIGGTSPGVVAQNSPTVVSIPNGPGPPVMAGPSNTAAAGPVTSARTGSAVPVQGPPHGTGPQGNPGVPQNSMPPAGSHMIVSAGGPPHRMAMAKPPRTGPPPMSHPQAVVARGPATVVVVASNPAVGPDPFYVEAPKPPSAIVIGVGPGTHKVLLPPIVNDPTIAKDTSLPAVGLAPTTFQDQTPRRVDGILRGSDGVFALLESNGVSRTVQPGDTVDGAMVVSIDQAGVTLRTEDNHTIHVPLSDTPQVESR